VAIADPSQGAESKEIQQPHSWRDVANGEILDKRAGARGMDQTLEAQLRATLRTSEEQFRLVIDNIAGLVATLTPSGEIDFVNRQVLEYFGRTFDELKTWQANDAVHLVTFREQQLGEV